jgi:hypothetical protein
LGKIPAPVAAEHVLPPVDDALLLRSLLDVDGAGGETWAWLVERTGGLDGVLAENPRLERHLPALAAAAATWDPPPDAATAERLAAIEPVPAQPPSLAGRSAAQALVDVLVGAVDDRTPSAHRDRQWVVDAVLLLRAHPDLDWDEVVERAERAHRATTAEIQLVHLRDVFDAPVDQVRLEARARLQVGRADEGDRRETAAVRAWARDDGADVRDVPRSGRRDLVAKAWQRRGALWHQVRRPADEGVLYVGEGNLPSRQLTYPSLAAFEAGMPSRSPLAVDACRFLVAQNTDDPRFVDWAGPKVLFALEPPGTPAVRAAVLRDDPNPQGEHVVAFGDPDPARRLPYPSLPRHRGPWVQRLRDELRRPRHHLVAMLTAWRPTDAFAFDQEDLRREWARAFGHDLDLYGKNGAGSERGWRSLPGYRGPTTDKLHCLHDAAFNLCFENCDRPGYLTEKRLESLMAGAIPLFRGGGGLGPDIVPDGAFIDCRDREPGDVLEQVRSMSEHERVERRAAGVEWLASEEADRYSWQGLASVLSARLRAQQ